MLMLIAEGMWLKTGDSGWLTLAKRWSKGTAVIFVAGAVSGTVLSFELGLLWPTFMEHGGSLSLAPAFIWLYRLFSRAPRHPPD